MSPKGVVLLVDDEPAFLKSVSISLKKIYDYEVHTAESGNEALKVLQGSDIDILITDVRMPEMDGIELVKRALDFRPYLQCIIITGHGDVDIAEEAKKLDCLDYANKPLQVAWLDLSINRGLERLELITSKISPKGLRESCVETMNYSLICWKLTREKGQNSELDLAEQSGIWSVTPPGEGDSGPRARTMEKYQRLSTLPKKRPQYDKALETAHYVLENCMLSDGMKRKLEARAAQFETLRNKYL